MTSITCAKPRQNIGASNRPRMRNVSNTTADVMAGTLSVLSVARVTDRGPEHVRISRSLSQRRVSSTRSPLLLFQQVLQKQLGVGAEVAKEQMQKNPLTFMA